jgi:hypothetical protein
MIESQPRALEGRKWVLGVEWEEEEKFALYLREMVDGCGVNRVAQIVKPRKTEANSYGRGVGLTCSQQSRLRGGGEQEGSKRGKGWMKGTDKFKEKRNRSLG